MNDLVRALAISAGILLPVVAFIIVISIATVKRGEASLNALLHPHDHVISDVTAVHGSPAAAAVAAKAAPKAAGPVPTSDEISVPMILIMGVGVFTVTVLLLFLLSLLQHMG